MAKKIINVISTIILILLICIVILVFNARISGEVPSAFGYQVYRVSSGSMEPQLMIGDVIIVKETDLENIHKGDIVTYRGSTGEMAGRPITHMVTEEPVCTNGEYVFQTQGVAEGTIPDPPVYGDQIYGVFVAKVPYLDRLYTFFLSDYGLITFVGIIVILFGYELISLIVSYKSLDMEDDESTSLDDDNGDGDNEDTKEETSD